MIYAVDFDGYLCENAWPEIGEPHTEIIEHFKALRADGNKLILWTCREGEKLKQAIEWCRSHGLEFDSHNENLPEMIELFGNDCRKIGADYYCDDKNYCLIKGTTTVAGTTWISSSLHDTVIEMLEQRAKDAEMVVRCLKNELCLKCEKYKQAHNGACDGCRWKE